MADALATGLLAAGAAGLTHIAALEDYSAYIIGTAGVVRVTPGFPPTTSPARGGNGLRAHLLTGGDPEPGADGGDDRATQGDGDE